MPEGCATGYGIDRDGKTVCFACCAVRNRADMIATGRATLYLTARDAEGGGSAVTTSPGPAPTSGFGSRAPTGTA